MELQASAFSNGEATVLISTLSRNINYRFRAFIETDNNIFYSDIVTFLSQGSKTPTLERITPDTGSSGDTISLIVKDFGIDSAANQVGFNDSFAEIISREDSLWRVVVPVLPPSDPFFQTGEVDVFVTKYNLTSNRLPFVLKNFSVTGTLPEVVKSGEQINLTGEGFVSGQTQVIFDNLQVNLVVESENLLRIWVPSFFESSTGSFTVSVGTVSKETNEVTIIAPTFDPDNFTSTIGPGLPYEISGTNLDNPNLELLVNDIEVNITSKEADHINFTIPNDLCTKTLQIDARIRTTVKTIATELPFAAPEISNLSVIDPTYNGRLQVSFRFFPSGQSISGFVNGTRVVGSQINPLSQGEITIEYQIPRDLFLNDAGDLDFSFEICDKTITQDRFAQIPSPAITNAPP